MHSARSERLCAPVDRALEAEDPFAAKPTVPDDVHAALLWLAERTAEEVMCEREKLVEWIEQCGSQFRESGAAAQWFQDCDPSIREVARTVNGPLLMMLAEAAEHCDKGTAP